MMVKNRFFLLGIVLLILVVSSYLVFAQFDSRIETDELSVMEQWTNIDLSLTCLADKALPNFKQMKVFRARKKYFIQYLLSLSKRANDRVLAQRKTLFILKNTKKLSLAQREWLGKLAHQYKIKDWDAQSSAAWQMLLKRVDIVPASLLMTQAAKESAWGTSRFAIQGNNLFGQRCYVKGCGLIPKGRADGKRYEVKRFPCVIESVESYIRNLNTNPHYDHFRTLRANLRRQNERLIGLRLIWGLSRYSQRGVAYIRELRLAIVQNSLTQYDRA